MVTRIWRGASTGLIVQRVGKCPDIRKEETFCLTHPAVRISGFMNIQQWMKRTAWQYASKIKETIMAEMEEAAWSCIEVGL